MRRYQVKPFLVFSGGTAFLFNVNHTVACGICAYTPKQIDLKFKCFNNIRGGGWQMLAYITNEELIGFEGWDTWGYWSSFLLGGLEVN